MEFNEAEIKEKTINNTKQYYGKPKLSQVPVSALKAICEVDEFGAQKYSKGNWVNVDAELFIDAALRHIYAMQDIKIDENGQKIIYINLSKKDKESNIEHVKHALCSLAYAIEIEERKS